MGIQLKFSHFLKSHAGTVAGWYQQAASAIAAILCVPLILKSLGPEQTGIWLGFQSLLSIAMLADFGFGYVASRQVAFALGGNTDMCLSPDIDHAQKGWQGVVNTLSMARLLNLFSCILAFLLLSGLGVWVGLNQKFQILPIGELLLTWGFLSLSVILTMQAKPNYAVLEGAGYLPLARYIIGTQSLIGGVGAAICAYSGGSLLRMSLVITCASLAGAFYAYHRVHLLLVPYSLIPFRAKGQLMKFFKVAWPMGMVNVGAYFFSAIQVPLIALFLTPALVAPYYMMQRCGQFINISVLQFLFPVLPNFSRILASGEIVKTRILLKKTILRVSILSFFAALIFLFILPYALKYLLGVTALGFPVLIAMAVDYLFLNISVSCGHFVLASGRNPFWIPNIIAGILNLIVIFLLMKWLGVQGVVLSTLISGVLVTYRICISEYLKLDRDLALRE